MSRAHSPAPLRTASLRLRFLLAVMLWVVLGTAAIWLSATRVFTKHVEQGFHDELDVHVHELFRLARVDREGHPELIRPLSDPRYEVPLSGYYWQVTAGGKTLRSESMIRGSLSNEVARSNTIARLTESGPTGPAIAYGMAAETPSGKQVQFVIATDQSELDRVLAGFTRELTIGSLISGKQRCSRGRTTFQPHVEAIRSYLADRCPTAWQKSSFVS